MSVGDILREAAKHLRFHSNEEYQHKSPPDLPEALEALATDDDMLMGLMVKTVEKLEQFSMIIDMIHATIRLQVQGMDSLRAVVKELNDEVEKLKERELLFAKAYDDQKQRVDTLIMRLKKHAVLADVLRDL